MPSTVNQRRISPFAASLVGPVWKTAYAEQRHRLRTGMPDRCTREGPVQILPGNPISVRISASVCTYCHHMPTRHILHAIGKVISFGCMQSLTNLKPVDPLALAFSNALTKIPTAATGRPAIATMEQVPLPFRALPLHSQSSASFKAPQHPNRKLYQAPSRRRAQFYRQRHQDLDLASPHLQPPFFHQLRHHPFPPTQQRQTPNNLAYPLSLQAWHRHWRLDRHSPCSRFSFPRRPARATSANGIATTPQ